MTKTFFTAAAVAAVLFSLFAAPAGAAYCGEDTFAVVSPALSDYVDAENPVLAALDGDTAAVCDGQGGRIILAGGRTGVLDVSGSLADGEKITGLLFSDHVPYVLTDRFRLLSAEDGTAVPFDEDIHSAASDGKGNLYYYYGTSSLFREDGVRFRDGAKLISGSSSFATDGDTAWFVKEGVLYALPLAEASSATVFAEDGASRVLCAAGHVFTVSDTDVSKYEPNGDLVSRTPLSEAFPGIPDCGTISTDGTSFILIDGEERALRTFSGEDYAEMKFYGTAGGGTGRFRSPEYVRFAGENRVAVWDRGNSRVCLFDTSQETFGYFGYGANHAFERFCTDGKTAVFTKGRDFYTASLSANGGNAGFTVRAAERTPGAVCVRDGTIFYGDSSSGDVFKCAGNGGNLEGRLFCSLPSPALQLEILGNDIPVLYALTREGIGVYTEDGGEEAFLHGRGILSFAADCAGNVLALERSEDGGFSIETHVRSFDGFTAGNVLTLENAAFSLEDVPCLALWPHGERKPLYAADRKKNVLLRIDADYACGADFEGVRGPDPEEVRESAYYVKSRGCAVYGEGGNFRTATDVSAPGEVLCAFGRPSYGDAVYVLTDRGKTGFVPRNRLEGETEPESRNGYVISISDTINVHSLPYAGAERIEGPDGKTVFSLLHDCAGFGGRGPDGYWYKVSFRDGETTREGYVRRTAVADYEPPPEPERKAYAKVAGGPGGRVNVYALRDGGSAILKTLADGTKVRLLEDYDAGSRFTLCEHDGVSGYIETASLRPGTGLTDGQIAAIALTSATAAITGTYLIVMRRKKKRTDAERDGDRN